MQSTPSRKTWVEDDGEEDFSQKIMRFFGGMFGGGGGFDFGSILLFVAVICGGYFIAHQYQDQIGDMLGEGGREKVHKFFNKADVMINNVTEKMGFTLFEGAEKRLALSMTVEETQEALHKYAGLSAEQAKILVPYMAGKEALVKLIESTGSKLTDPLNDKVIYALLTQKPDMLRKLIDTVPASGTATSGDVLKKITDAFKTIAADRPRFEALLANEQSLGVLAHAASRFSPVPLSEKDAIAMIRAFGFDKAGKPQADLGARVAAVLDNPQQAATEMLKTATPETVAEKVHLLLNNIDRTKVKDPLTRDALQVLQENPTQTGALLKNIPAEKLPQLLPLFQGGNKADITSFVLKEPAFKTFVDSGIDLSKLPAGDLKNSLTLLHMESARALQALAAINDRGELEHVQALAVDEKHQFSLQKVMQSVASADGRATLRKAGLDDVAVVAQETTRNSALTARTLQTIVDLEDAIDKNPDNAAHAERTKTIRDGLASIIGHPVVKPFGELQAKEFAAFFQNPTNVAAFGTALNALDLNSFNPSERIRLEALKKAWGTTDHGLAEVLGSPEGAALLLAHFNDPKFTIPDTVCKAEKPGLTQDIGMWLVGGKVRKNSDDLKDVIHAFESTNCATALQLQPLPAAAPASRPHLEALR